MVRRKRRSDGDDVEWEAAEVAVLPAPGIEASLTTAQRSMIGAAAGGMAGGIVSAVLHPIDTVKTLMQVGQTQKIATSPPKPSSQLKKAAAAAAAAVPRVVAVSPSTTIESGLRGSGGVGVGAAVNHAKRAMLRGGGVRALYRGISAASIGSIPSSALYFGTYESFKMGVGSFNAAIIGNIASSLVFVPKEVLKQRMQANTVGAATMGAGGRNGSKLVGALRCVLRERGVRGLYVGFTASVLRNAPSNAINFWTFERLRSMQLRRKERRQKSTPADRPSARMRRRNRGRTESRDAGPQYVARAEGGRLTVLESMLIGCVSGTCAAVLTTPIDVVKTQIMTSPGGRHALRQGLGVYNDFPSRLAGIWRAEGTRGLCRGMAPRVLYSALFGATGFMAFEQIRARLALAVLASEDSKSKRHSASLERGSYPYHSVKEGRRRRRSTRASK